MVDDFFRFLAANLPLGIDGDRLRWKLTKNGDFTIRSYYHKLYGSSFVVFLWKGIWKVRFHGSPHVGCQIFYLIDGIGWGSIHLTFRT